MVILKSAGRSSRFAIAMFVSCLCFNDAASGQAPKRIVAPSAGSTMVFVRVRDTNGRSLAGVRLVMDGATPGEFTTDVEGVIRLRSMQDGAYHLRFDRKGFSSQERELTIRGGQPDVVDITLSVAQPAPLPAVLPAADRPAVVPQPPRHPEEGSTAKSKGPAPAMPGGLSEESRTGPIATTARSGA